jgi:hypothetical protein
MVESSLGGSRLRGLLATAQMAGIGAERVCSRRRDTPKKPGEAWGPTFSEKRKWGTEYPRVARPGACCAGEQVSTGDGAVVGFPKKPTPRGTLAAMLTWGRWYVRDRDESRCRSREHAIERCLDDPQGGGAKMQIASPVGCP